MYDLASRLSPGKIIATGALVYSTLLSPMQNIHADPIPTDDLIAKVDKKSEYTKIKKLPETLKTPKSEPKEPDKPKPKVPAQPKENELQNSYNILFPYSTDLSLPQDFFKPITMDEIYSGNFGVLNDKDAIEYWEDGWSSQVRIDGKFKPDIGGIAKIIAASTHATNLHYTDTRNNSRFTNGLFEFGDFIHDVNYHFLPKGLKILKEFREYELLPFLDTENITNPLHLYEVFKGTFDPRDKFDRALNGNHNKKESSKKSKKPKGSIRGFLKNHKFGRFNLGASTRIDDLGIEPAMTLLQFDWGESMTFKISLFYNRSETRAFRDHDAVYGNTFIRD